MRHLFYSAVLGLGALSLSAVAMAENTGTQAYSGPVATQSTSQMRGDDSRDMREETATQQPEHNAVAHVHSDTGVTLSQHNVSEMQRALKSEGFSVSVDGIWGPTTSRAVSDFQEANQLPVTGEPDNQTLAALNINPNNARPARR